MSCNEKLVTCSSRCRDKLLKDKLLKDKLRKDKLRKDKLLKDKLLTRQTPDETKS